MTTATQALIAELNHEAANTRKMLLQVPESHFGWKPHEKSMSLIQLAYHVADVGSWFAPTFDTTDLDMKAFSPVPMPQTSVELMEIFERNITQAQETLARATDASLGEMWTMRSGDHVFFTLPRGVVVRNMLMNHLYHHRGQLSVYLRLLGVSVPGVYGSSADEK